MFHLSSCPQPFRGTARVLQRRLPRLIAAVSTIKAGHIGFALSADRENTITRRNVRIILVPRRGRHVMAYLTLEQGKGSFSRQLEENAMRFT
jgi:hypothetical protein